MQLQARDISRFFPEAIENEGIKVNTTYSRSHTPTKCEVARPAHVSANAGDFDGMADALQDSLDILTVGPGRQKLALTRNLIGHHLAMAEEVVSTKAADHPSDAQLLAYARNYFVNQDFFRDIGQVAESTLSEKVDISRVLIQRVEGVPSKARVSSLEAANAVLEGWASGTPGFSHDQSIFQIVFEDGFRYYGRYRLNESKKRVSLSRHVRMQLKTLATITDVKKHAQTSDESVINLISANLAQAAKIALNHYNI